MTTVRLLIQCVVSSVLVHVAVSAEPPEPIEFPKIDRRPGPSQRPLRKLETIPHFSVEAATTNPWVIDLRERDVSHLDLRDRLNDLLHATFDDRTVWPAEEKLPKEFDRRRIMELGKDPGLGVRSLHERGITGRGVGIGIIDQPMITRHREYADRLRLYEEISLPMPTMSSEMHGPAVASIAVGETTGVAPGADLYFIAAYPGDFSRETGFKSNFRHMAKGICRLLEVNEQLPRERKIRVISISVGWSPGNEGYEEITEACEKARAAGMLIVCSSIDRVHGFKFNGLGRSATVDPNSFESYGPAISWSRWFFGDESIDNSPWPADVDFSANDRLLVPMDSRTVAAQGGTDMYTFYRIGEWSWSIPYIAGAYALAAQVDTKITPERFWNLALKTGRTIKATNGSKTLPLGPVLDPVALIDELDSKAER